MSLDAVDWPSSWRRVPLWSLYQRIKDVGHPEEEMLSVYRDFGVVRKESRDDNHNKTAENRDIYQLVDPGWLIINRMKAWQGSLGVSPLRGIVSGHYICFRPLHTEDDRFLNYLLRSPIYTAELRRLSRGVRPNQIEIDNEMLTVLPVYLPDLQTQRAIADFLDEETARIDALSEARLRVIGLLDERVDSVIRTQVGRCSLADSRGEVGALPIKRLVSRVARQSAPAAEMITAYRDGQVTARSHRRAEGYTESEEAGTNVQGVLKGDIVVHGLDGFAGAIGCAEVDGACSPAYHVCTPSAGGDPDYIARMLRILAVTGYLEIFATSTRERAIDFRNWDLFGRIHVPDVDPLEQARVGGQIRALRPLHEKVSRYVKLVGEHRQALITAAVTGQLEIPGVAA